MKALRGAVDWSDDHREARIRCEIDMRPGRVRLTIRARTDRRSRAITFADPETGARSRAGLVSTSLRWTDGTTGPADLHLSWPDDASVAVDYGEVSNLERLATDPQAQRAVRALLGLLPSSGRTSKRAERIAAIARVAAELGDEATKDSVAQRLGKADDFGEPSGAYNRDVTAAGGWGEILKLAREL